MTTETTQDPRSWQVVQYYCRPDGVTVSHRYPERLTESEARARVATRKPGPITFRAERWAKRTKY